ncbi:MAG: glutamate 5-kinase [Chitinispirillia bacterium]|nr:glutamate 5-kinase [Chitinispirillia bacterium]MCL2242202.1 glutamate 5-kinase [Chitinispirillia bacterium]
MGSPLPYFRKELASSVKTLVVKTGSRILTAAGHEGRVRGLVEDLSALRKAGVRVVLVSSGAIAHGMKALSLTKRPAQIPMQQACAAIGQNRLMGIYQDFFEENGVVIGQVLLTWDDLRSKKRYLNLRNTLFQLLDCGAIPIINENDSVGVEEIQFGNNDALGAQIALLVNADLYVNLTDVGGLYDKNPRTAKDAKHIPVVKSVSSGIQSMAADKKNDISVGGMSTKLKAAQVVTRAGICALIGDGFDQRLLTVLKDESCATLFLPAESKMPSRRRWIAFSGQSAGAVIVDDGARKAILEKGKSLLAAGITGIRGNFRAGDMVDIADAGGNVVARGLVNFTADELTLIRGCKTSEISSKLGAIKFNEVILRDNLVILV